MYQISGAIFIDAVDFWGWVQQYLLDTAVRDSDEDVFFDERNVCIDGGSRQDIVLTECETGQEYRVPLEDFWEWIYDKYQPTEGDEYFYGVPEYHPDAHCMRVDFVASDGGALPPYCHLRWQWRKLEQGEKYNV